MENAKVKSLTDYRSQVTSWDRQPAAVVVPPSSPAKPRLLDQVRHAIRTRHYSPRTEETYVGWIKQFIFFQNKRHPVEMGEKEIARAKHRKEKTLDRNGKSNQAVITGASPEGLSVHLHSAPARRRWMSRLSTNCNGLSRSVQVHARSHRVLTEIGCGLLERWAADCGSVWRLEGD